jgi:hypothetical protein
MRLCACLLLSTIPLAAQTPAPLWKFAVSGDSRNCGDLVMPAIAAGVRQSGAEFYWHLGDFRAIYEFDEDLVPPSSLGLPSKVANVIDYLTSAWPDFIRHQLAPFGDLPIYLAMGNHETIPPATREAWLLQFADWLEQPRLIAQRLHDNPFDRKLHAYYHWIDRGIDFVTLDNASQDQFDPVQLAWISKVIAADEASSGIKTIVVAMHAALPGSVGHNHSMGDWPLGDKTGREVYLKLWHAQETAHKKIYLLASHSHFYMEDVFHTADWSGKVLPGWIVGTAGAVRYRLPAEAAPRNNAKTDVYGYLIATVMSDSTVKFAFRQLSETDLKRASPDQSDKLIDWCVQQNRQ